MTHTGVCTEAREALERRWYPRMTREPQLARAVTGQAAQREPFHRWMNYRQGFSPELVRLFLGEAERSVDRPPYRPVLDPFSGSGTVVIECARRGVRARGVEAMASLAFLASVAAEKSVPELPDVGEVEGWEPVADRLELPVHRAALMYAVGRRHTSAGKPNPNAPPLLDVLHEVVRMMRDDMRRPLPFVNPVERGDARHLDHLEPGAIGGILTSPPYLSRHDYTRVLGPYEMVYEHWHPAGTEAERRAIQIAAFVGLPARREAGHPAPEAVTEACNALTLNGERRLAALVRVYFEDLFDVLAACHRVLRAGGSCWMVIGGARLKGIHVPSDLVIADAAASGGFEISSVRVARNLIDMGRKLGRLINVAPRETLLTLRKLGR